MGESKTDSAIEESPLTVNKKDPKCVYRWVAEQNVEKMKYKGFIVVLASGVPKTKTKPAEGKQDAEKPKSLRALMEEAIDINKKAPQEEALQDTGVRELTKEIPVGRTHTSTSPIRYETLVLMKTSREKYQTQQKKLRDKTQQQIDSIESSFIEQARKNKVQIVKEKKIS